MLPLSRRVLSRLVPTSRPKSSIADFLQSNVWKKSNSLYITYVCVAAVVVEFIYGGVTNSIWETVNAGKLYHQVDWSKFKSEDEEDEEEKVEEDEEEKVEEEE